MDLYFSQVFGVEPRVLEGYGAFDINLASDLPLFVDPFLLFNSTKPEYRALHDGMLRYLRFLRDKTQSGPLTGALVSSLFRFKEVKQNWLGFCVLGNEGHALGPRFAAELHANLSAVFSDFGTEKVTLGSHLEKLTLLSDGVGRDGISDLTTNLIKQYLCEYTQGFAAEHLPTAQLAAFSVPKVRFNYDTESWQPMMFTLPVHRGDFVLLTPSDILTRDETWISNSDLIQRFYQLPPALPDEELRAQVNNYFATRLPTKPTAEDFGRAVRETVRQYPTLLDYYIRTKEDSGDQATGVSRERVQDTREVFVDQLKRLFADLEQKTDFYDRGWSSYNAAMDRVLAFKHYVEDQDGYRLINRKGVPFAQEAEVHLYFGLIWFGTAFDVSHESNAGRGPVDFKVSLGSRDKALVEFKLASNTKLKRNLEKQLAIYERANDTEKSIKVVICYTAADQARVEKILKELGIAGHSSIVIIDARSDNKPSASTA